MLEPGLLPVAVEELLRWCSPAIPTRTATVPVELAGIALEPGERVHCPLAAANRDPKYYPDPDVPSLDRDQPKPHLTFGLGAHRCVGSHVARLEIAVALEEWHRRVGDYELIEAGPSHLGGVWGIETLRLRF